VCVYPRQNIVGSKEFPSGVGAPDEDKFPSLAELDHTINALWKTGISLWTKPFDTFVAKLTVAAWSKKVLHRGSHELDRLAFDHAPLVCGGLQPRSVDRNCRRDMAIGGMK
jgi:hypothetical protein